MRCVRKWGASGIEASEQRAGCARHVQAVHYEGRLCETFASSAIAVRVVQLLL